MGKRVRGILIGFGMFCFIMFSIQSHASMLRNQGTIMLPLNCAELLPDSQPFIDFFETVAKGVVGSDEIFAKRLFRVLALRKILYDSGSQTQEENPVDILVRRTLCFYREQKEPIKPIAYDNGEFLRFLRAASLDLEIKVDEVVYQWEFERHQRSVYESRLEKNMKIIEAMQQEAQLSAEQKFETLSKKAKSKVTLH